MKKKTATKKGKKRKHKKQTTINNIMEEEKNGKYDGVYKAAIHLKAKRKPQDRTLSAKHMAQDKGRCVVA